MTIAELRKALEGLPDNMLVQVHLEDWYAETYEASVYEWMPHYPSITVADTFVIETVPDITKNL